MQYRVLRRLEADRTYQPGDVIEADRFHNVTALINQRYLEPLGEDPRVSALEARIAGLEAQVRDLVSRQPRKGS